jgi:hypothetical protein
MNERDQARAVLRAVCDELESCGDLELGPKIRLDIDSHCNPGWVLREFVSRVLHDGNEIPLATRKIYAPKVPLPLNNVHLLAVEIIQENTAIRCQLSDSWPFAPYDPGETKRRYYWRVSYVFTALLYPKPHQEGERP